MQQHLAFRNSAASIGRGGVGGGEVGGGRGAGGGGGGEENKEETRKTQNKKEANKSKTPDITHAQTEISADGRCVFFVNVCSSCMLFLLAPKFCVCCFLCLLTCSMCGLV